MLVQDNLNTHKTASLYEAFPLAEARRLAERFEWHFTPRHGSWLDMAESELSILSNQCLASAFIVASLTKTLSSARSQNGRYTETEIMPKPIGSSQTTTPASNSNDYIPQCE